MGRTPRDFESRASTNSATRAGAPIVPLDRIEELCSFEHRAAGTDAERDAALYLAKALERSGRTAKVEPIRVRPAYSLVFAAHIVLAVVGTILSVRVPIAGFVLLLLTGISLFGDLTARFHIVRMLFPIHSSQNVTSYGTNPRAPERLVLVAHYDAAYSGLLFNRRFVKPAAQVASKIPFTVGPFFFLFWNVLALLGGALFRIVGVDSAVLTGTQFLLTVPLLAALPLLIDIATSAVVPAANDNASGVAAVLELASRLDRREQARVENIDIWIVFTGAEEGLMLGMRQWLRDHRRELSQKPTYFINIDSVGYGNPCFVTAEGLAVLFSYDRVLVNLCREIAAVRGSNVATTPARPLVSRLSHDAIVPQIQGHPAITITCRGKDGLAPTYRLPTDTPNAIEPEAIEQAIGFCEELVIRLDQKVGAQPTNLLRDGP